MPGSATGNSSGMASNDNHTSRCRCWVPTVSAKVPPKAARWPAAIRSTAARRRSRGNPVGRWGAGRAFDKVFFKGALQERMNSNVTVIERSVLEKIPFVNANIGKTESANAGWLEGG